jgi:hypothetical protein
MSLLSRIIDFFIQPIPPLPPQSHYDHIALCDPTNCDISGDEWMVRRFVQIAKATIARGETCLLYEVRSDFDFGNHAHPDKIWPIMRDEHFRNAVILLLPEGKFMPPDDLDEWVFVLQAGERRRMVGDAQSRGPLGLD